MAELTTTTTAPDGAPEAGGPPSPSTPAPVYGAHYYDNYHGGPYEFEGEFAAFFYGLADRIIRQFRPGTVLDAGCAKGFLVHALRERGVEAYGIDISDYAVDHALEPVRPFVRQGSVTEPLDRRYDLITCVETLEHLPPGDVRTAVDVLGAATDLVLLSSTPEAEHYGEPSHTSMRPPEEWAALFAEHGFLPDYDVDVSWLTPWALVLKREPALTVPEVVRVYGRQLARLQREVGELRRSALDMERELEDVESGALAPLRAENERLRRGEERAVAAQTEALRLRDLLIVAERSLGQVRGEVTRLQDQLQDHAQLAADHHAVITSTTWRLAWKVFGPYRRWCHRRRHG